MNINLKDLNSLLCEKILSKKPFSVLRIDNTFGYISQCIHNNTKPSEQFFNETSLSLEGGINPGTKEYFVNEIYPRVLDVMKTCDILGFVDMSLDIEKDKNFLNTFGDKPMYFGHEHIMIMDPIGLLRGGHQIEQKLDPIWLSLLKGKKVLVISTHVESILHQWKQIEKVWGEHIDTIVPYDLVGVIKSPYHPSLDNRQYPNCNTWLDTVKFIKNEIDSYDYDVLLAGCTTSAPIFAEHAKQMGKIGIQTGGVLQLHYGIKGYRWADIEGYKEWRKYFNEYWIYPLEEDAPKNKVASLESHFAYWKK